MYGYQHILHSEKPLTKCLWNVILVVDLHKKGNVRKIDVQGNSLHRVLCLKQGHGEFFLFNDPYLYIILLINYIYRVGEHLDRHIPFCCFDHQAPGRCISTCKDFKSYLFPAKQDFSFLYHSWLNSHNKIDLQSVQPFSLWKDMLLSIVPLFYLLTDISGSCNDF